jgi:hypothetical protein
LPFERIVEHSAKVQIWLEVEDRCVSVSQVGENSLLLSDSVASSAFDMSLLGHVIAIVDGLGTEYLIAIKSRFGRRVDFEHCMDHADHIRELECTPF